MELEKWKNKISQWIYGTNDYSDYKYFKIVDFQEIVPILSPNSDEFFQKYTASNRRLLLHATQMRNRDLIESQGLRVFEDAEMRNTRRNSESLAVYFADMSHNIMNFSRPCANDNLVLLYVCDVAIGKPRISEKRERVKFDVDLLGDDYNSFFIEGFERPVETEPPDWELDGAGVWYSKIKIDWGKYKKGDNNTFQLNNEYAVIDPERIDLRFRVVLKVEPTLNHKHEFKSTNCFPNVQGVDEDDDDNIDLNKANDVEEMDNLINRYEARFGSDN